MAVGAFRDDGAAKRTGAVYLFDRSGGGSYTKVTPSDGEPGDNFGQPIVIYGDTMLVGSPNSRFVYTRAGAAYAFDLQTGRELKLRPEEDGYDGFGSNLAMHGTVAVVSSWDDDRVVYGGGSATIFDLTTGEKIARVEPEAPHQNQFFGAVVSTSDELVLVTSEMRDRSGSVDVYDAKNGHHITQLRSPDRVSGRLFGWSSAISGRYALLYCEYFDTPPMSTVYLYDLANFQPVARLAASNPADRRNLDFFCVHFRGTQAVVGSPLDEPSGAVYVFDLAAHMFVADRATPFGRLDVFDLTSFVRDFGAGEADVDLAEPFGVLDIRDVQAFLDAYAAGCPGG